MTLERYVDLRRLNDIQIRLLFVLFSSRFSSSYAPTKNIDKLNWLKVTETEPDTHNEMMIILRKNGYNRFSFEKRGHDLMKHTQQNH